MRKEEIMRKEERGIFYRKVGEFRIGLYSQAWIPSCKKIPQKFLRVILLDDFVL